MVLGIYWYFGFPDGLYRFDLFKFQCGYGGHADNPAMLTACIETSDPAFIIQQLKDLVNYRKYGYLFIYQQDNQLQIGKASRQLFDYDFLFMTEVEKIVKNNNVKLIEDRRFKDISPIYLENKNECSPRTIYPQKGFLQVAASEPRKYNAEHMVLRLDCNMPVATREPFISAIGEIAKSENIHVLYYKYKGVGDKVNLMIFFSNGRQGLDFKDYQFIDIISFENKIEEVLKNYNVARGHIPGKDNYPLEGPDVELIVDRDLILDR